MPSIICFINRRSSFLLFSSTIKRFGYPRFIIRPTYVLLLVSNAFHIDFEMFILHIKPQCPLLFPSMKPSIVSIQHRTQGVIRNSKYVPGSVPVALCERIVDICLYQTVNHSKNYLVIKQWFFFLQLVNDVK